MERGCRMASNQNIYFTMNSCFYLRHSQWVSTQSKNTVKWPCRESNLLDHKQFLVSFSYTLFFQFHLYRLHCFHHFAFIHLSVILFWHEPVHCLINSVFLSTAAKLGDEVIFCSFSLFADFLHLHECFSLYHRLCLY